MTENATLNRWLALPEAFVVEKVRESFAHLTGERLPASKGKTKNADGITPDQWFHQSSFLHMHIFHFSFLSAKERGLLNAVEVALCEEVMAILSEA